MGNWVATPLLVVKCGATSPAVRVSHGDYDRWFLRALAPSGVALRVVDARGPLPAAAGGARGIVVTGSPSSVTERAPWMIRTGAWLRAHAGRGVPVLGVCFGHQLLAEAFGGRVGRCARGREIGTIACTLTAAGRADPLLAGLPPRFDALATHEDEVVELPPGAVLLATNGWSRVQAYAIGPNVRCVQFHPELDAGTLAALVTSRAGVLAAEARARGEDGAAAVATILAGVRPAPAAARILPGFAAGLGAPARRAPAAAARPGRPGEPAPPRAQGSGSLATRPAASARRA
jgi:GMP synthase (glutamine-hydrolysing)